MSSSCGWGCGALVAGTFKRGHGMRGRTLPPETRAKISAAHKGRIITAEHRRKISEALTGIKRSDETRAKVSANWNQRQERHPRWKGDDVGAHAIHGWLLRNFTKTGTCELCGAVPVRKIRSPAQFAFRHHPKPHTRRREDYYEVCIPCHRALDRSSYLRKHTE